MKLMDILEWGKDADTDNSKKGMLKRGIKVAIILVGTVIVLAFALKESPDLANSINSALGM